MFTLLNLAQPTSLDEAYQILSAQRNNAVLGGCAFLRLGSRRISTAVDLSKLDLAYIRENAEEIEIGAMATFRDVETSPILQNHFNGVVAKAVSHVIGVQFRNIVTVGASVFSKYGFSDLLPPLLALDTDVQLCMGGRLPLAAFLKNPYKKDILTKVIIKKNNRKAAYQQLRNSSSDFPLLNAAVSELNGNWRIVVGARPGRAKFARRAAEVLTAGGLTQENIDFAANVAAEELRFETNTRATAQYRKAVCQALVRRAVLEVEACK